MPIDRKNTPPTSKIKEERSVLNTLSAWTDNGEEEDEKKQPLLERQVSVKDKFMSALDSESDNFHLCIGVVILANAIVIGLETEYGRSHFIILENIFNACFFIEMVLRMRQLGCAYWQDAWNWFDFSLVMIGTLDLWIMPHFAPAEHVKAVKSKQVGYQFSVLRLLRILRLLRVLRVVRLFRMFHQLFLIMQAFNKAFQIVLLIGVLVAILDYAIAIILTQAIGHNTSLEWGEDKHLIQEWFGTIPNSMQTLFLVMTLTGWGKIADTVTQQIPSPLVYTVLVLYIMVTSYTMISLITGIISESLITSQQEYRRKQLTKMDGKRRELVNELRDFLQEMHEEEQDELGAIEAEDLKTSVRGDNALLGKLADIGVAIDEKGVLGLIDKMSLDGTQRINIIYFVDKLTNLQGFANASAVIDLKYELLRIQTTIHNIACKTWPNDPPLLTPKVVQEEAPRRNSAMYADTSISKKSSLREMEPSGSAKPKRASGCVKIQE